MYVMSTWKGQVVPEGVSFGLPRGEANVMGWRVMDDGRDNENADRRHGTSSLGSCPPS